MLVAWEKPALVVGTPYKLIGKLTTDDGVPLTSDFATLPIAILVNGKNTVFQFTRGRCEITLSGSRGSLVTMNTAPGETIAVIPLEVVF